MKKIIFILFIICLNSCGSGNKKENGALARVYNEYLYKTDIIGIVPSNTSSNDSVLIVKSFINNWIKQKLLLHSAESNLSSKQKDFDKQLEDYRNSLILFAYEKELIHQKLDTSISDSEMVSYYKKNPDEFLLKDNIVKVWYVKMPVNSSYKGTIRKLYKSETSGSRQQIEELGKKYAVNYLLDDSTWLYFNDVLKEIPIKTYNQEDYLKYHRYIEMEDSLYTYFVNIKGFQIKESLSPLSFEKENIKKIILNKRKIKLIENMEADIYKEALENKNFEIF